MKQKKWIATSVLLVVLAALLGYSVGEKRSPKEFAPQQKYYLGGGLWMVGYVDSTNNQVEYDILEMRTIIETEKAETEKFTVTFNIVFNAIGLKEAGEKEIAIRELCGSACVIDVDVSPISTITFSSISVTDTLWVDITGEETP